MKTKNIYNWRWQSNNIFYCCNLKRMSTKWHCYVSNFIGIYSNTWNKNKKCDLLFLNTRFHFRRLNTQFLQGHLDMLQYRHCFLMLLGIRTIKRSMNLIYLTMKSHCIFTTVRSRRGWRTSDVPKNLKKWKKNSHWVQFHCLQMPHLRLGYPKNRMVL